MEKLIDIFTHLSEPAVISRNIEYLVLIITINCFLEVLFPPVPGDAMLILGGSLAGYAGISPLWVIAGAFTGTFCASVILYKFGLGMERKMLHSHRFSVLLDNKTFLKLEKVLGRYGYALLLVSRFVPVVRSGIILAAGVVNLDQRKSLLAVAVSILASTSLFVLGGRFLGKKLDALMVVWHDHFRQILIGLAIALIVYLVVNGVNKYIKKKQEPRAE